MSAFRRRAWLNVETGLSPDTDTGGGVRALRAGPNIFARFFVPTSLVRSAKVDQA